MWGETQCQSFKDPEKLPLQSSQDLIYTSRHLD